MFDFAYQVFMGSDLTQVPFYLYLRDLVLIFNTHSLGHYHHNTYKYMYSKATKGKTDFSVNYCTLKMEFVLLYKNI